METAAKRLVICVDNSGYEVSLERRKIYVAVPDARAEKLNQVHDSSSQTDYIRSNTIVSGSLTPASSSATHALGAGGDTTTRLGGSRINFQPWRTSPAVASTD